MPDDFNRLTAQLPEGWSFTATRTGDQPRVYSAYSARQGLSTHPSTRVEDVVKEAHMLEEFGCRSAGEQLTLFHQKTP